MVSSISSSKPRPLLAVYRTASTGWLWRSRTTADWLRRVARPTTPNHRPLYSVLSFQYEPTDNGWLWVGEAEPRPTDYPSSQPFAPRSPKASSSCSSTVTRSPFFHFATQPQRPQPREAPNATTMARRRCLPRMVRRSPPRSSSNPRRACRGKCLAHSARRRFRVARALV